MNEAERIVFQRTAILDAFFWQRQGAAGSFLLLILLLMDTTALFSQSQRAPKAKSATIPIVPAQSLDLSGGHLPPHFVPIDPSELYEAASRALSATEKSEFETTAQYQERIAALTQKPLLRGLKASDDFAFVLRPSSRSISGLLQKRDDFLTVGFLEMKYDADSNQMSVSIPTRAGDLSGDYEWVSALHRSVFYGASYIGQNAFGVRRPVRRVKANTIEIDVGDYDWLSPNYTDDGLDDKVFTLNVDPDEARELSEDIEIIMIGSLRAPFTSHSVSGAEPSLDQVDGPTEITYVHRVLHISLDRLIIANGRTGAVLLAAPEPAERESPPATPTTMPTAVPPDVQTGSLTMKGIVEASLVEGGMKPASFAQVFAIPIWNPEGVKNALDFQNALNAVAAALDDARRKATEDSEIKTAEEQCITALLKTKKSVDSGLSGGTIHANADNLGEFILSGLHDDKYAVVAFAKVGVHAAIWFQDSISPSQSPRVELTRPAVVCADPGGLLQP